MLLFAFSCKSRTAPVLKKTATDTFNKKLDAVASDIDFFSDSVFHGHRLMLQYYFKKYGPDTSCGYYWMFRQKVDIIHDFEGLNLVGKIRRHRPLQIFRRGELGRESLLFHGK